MRKSKTVIRFTEKKSSNLREPQKPEEPISFGPKEQLSTNQKKLKFGNSQKKEGLELAEKILRINNKRISQQKNSINGYISILAKRYIIPVWSRQTSIDQLKQSQHVMDELQEQSDAYLEKYYGQDFYTNQMAKTLSLLDMKYNYLRAFVTGNKNKIKARLRIIQNQKSLRLNQERSALLDQLRQSGEETQPFFQTAIKSVELTIPKRSVQGTLKQVVNMQARPEPRGRSGDPYQQNYAAFFDFKKRQSVTALQMLGSSPKNSRKNLLKVNKWLEDNNVDYLRQQPISRPIMTRRESPELAYKHQRSHSLQHHEYKYKKSSNLLTSTCDQFVETSDDLRRDITFHRKWKDQQFENLNKTMMKFNQHVTIDHMKQTLKDFPQVPQ